MTDNGVGDQLGPGFRVVDKYGNERWLWRARQVLNQEKAAS